LNFCKVTIYGSIERSSEWFIVEFEENVLSELIYTLLNSKEETTNIDAIECAWSSKSGLITE
jgi:hypothetical protein